MSSHTDLMPLDVILHKIIEDTIDYKAKNKQFSHYYADTFYNYVRFLHKKAFLQTSFILNNLLSSL